jgi:putative peptide zinc metalloprotease protein
MRRRLLLIFAVALFGLGFGAAPALADGGENGSGDNSAIAINTTDGASVFKLAFAIRHVAGDVVDQTNQAVAYSSCSNCDTTAIAIEVVLVEGNPSVVTPQNVAVAVNYQCQTCLSFAAAYQFVVSTGGPVEFTKQGRKMLERIQHDLERLRHEQLTVAQLQARLDEIVARLKYVLSTQLVPARERHGEGDHGGGGGGGGPPESGASTVTEPTATETQSTSTEPTVTETSTTETTTGSTSTDTGPTDTTTTP